MQAYGKSSIRMKLPKLKLKTEDSCIYINSQKPQGFTFLWFLAETCYLFFINCELAVV